LTGAQTLQGFGARAGLAYGIYRIILLEIMTESGTHQCVIVGN
jgi:hypothetical protein